MHIKRFHSLGKGFTEDINISWVVPFCMKINARLHLKIAIFSVAFCVFFPAAWAQQIPSPDSTLKQAAIQADTTKFLTDSLALLNKPLTVDTLGIDTIAKTVKPKKEVIEAPVMFKGQDSLRFDVKGKRVFLYKLADISYQEINLKADFIQMDFENNSIYATGLKDSTGKTIGKPIFKEKDQEFKSEVISYNFKTEKGVIQKVITHDNDGYLHGIKVKKFPDKTINVSSGSYTSCNLDHPHFAFKFNRAKVIPENKIVTGPAYLTIQDVPTILVIPFGFFPNKKGQRSGIIIPTYGESAERGFYLERGGYYWAINDYLDLTLTGDIYTRGSWRISPEMRYIKRYKYSGNLNLGYARNVLGELGDANFSDRRDFSIQWSHRQDPKARPKSTFSSNVNIVSGSYNRYNPNTINNYFQNTFQSSITYQTRFGDNVFLNVAANHSQNTSTHAVNVTLPVITLSVNRFYPFRKKEATGKKAWYEDISMNYTSNAENRINTLDSLLFTDAVFNDMQNAVKHTIPISNSIKVLKYFNLTNSINYNERWYFKTIRKNWVNDSLITATDTTVGYVDVDTVNGFEAARDFSFSSSLSTRIYGMYTFKKGPVMAVRHVVNPSISFSYNPDFSSEFWGYYKPYQKDAKGTMGEYSIFEGAMYGSPPSAKSGRISFSISNNLEMKVRNRADTVTGTRKIVLIDNFSINTSYDLARDSLNWSKVTLSGRTVLFKKLNLTYSSSWDPYVLDSTGKRNLNKFEWDVNKRLLRIDNTNWNLSLNYAFEPKAKKDESGKSKKVVRQTSISPEDPEYQSYLANPDSYIDFDIPWKFNVSYTIRYIANHSYVNFMHDTERDLIQTLNLTGDVSITPKWKISFSTAYDFEAKKLASASLNFYRDLHCWEMRFNWIPIGGMKSWNFQINVKSSMLQDLKLTKKKDFRDSYY